MVCLDIHTGTMSRLFNEFLTANRLRKAYYYSKMCDLVFAERPWYKTTKDENTMYVRGFVDVVNHTYKEAVREKVMKRFDIKKAIFNKPYTIVIWEDGTKTIVKCAEGQAYDKYTGLVTCFLKRGFGDETIYPRVRKQIRKVLVDSDEKE